MSRSRAGITELEKEWRRHWPEAMTENALLTPALYRLQEHLGRCAERLLKPHGLQSADFEVLSALRASPPPHSLTPTELYRRLLVSSGGMTKILARLEDRGLITRPANPEDARSKLVTLAEPGKELIEKLTAALVTEEGKLLALLDDAPGLERVLTAWLDRIEKAG
ncbi:MarR family transcriptional regulator [Gallaecimonas sp. GXIMD4217]|uniref:MarR family winged helix-turn-helix transcriptional regulator n=1 Tax=Gallaecimonas sp. GXIMD4217 TaxID=3131927 RepID=UPI00311B0EBB